MVLALSMFTSGIPRALGRVTERAYFDLKGQCFTLKDLKFDSKKHSKKPLHSTTPLHSFTPLQVLAYAGGVHCLMSKSFFIFDLRIARVENNLNCRCTVRRYKNFNYVTYTKLYYCWICWWSGSISFRGLAVILFCVYFYA